MGFSSCPICTEDLQDDIVATKCGHVFHSVCVNQWLKENRACPTCRSKTLGSQLIKLFLNAPDDSFHSVESEEVSEVAFKKCKKLNDELKRRTEDLEETIVKLRSNCDEKDVKIKDITQAKSFLEREFKNTKQMCYNLKTKMAYIMDEAEKAKILSDRTVRLEREIATMSGLRTILEGAQEDCEDVLKNTSDRETMALYVAGLKRDYNSLQKSKTDLQRQAEESQRKLSFSRMKVQKLEGEVKELQRDKVQAEQDLSLAERRNDSLCRRMGTFEDRSIADTDLLNVSKDTKVSGRRSSPVQLSKRQKTEQSTPLITEDSLTRQFEEELSRDEGLDALAAELGVDIGITSTPSRPHQIQDNLFSKVGFDGLGGTARIRKPLPGRFSKQASSSSLAKSATIGNFFQKIIECFPTLEMRTCNFNRKI